MDNSGAGRWSISELLYRASTVPTYLEGDWFRDWGALQRLVLNAQLAWLDLDGFTAAGCESCAAATDIAPAQARHASRRRMASHATAAERRRLTRASVQRQRQSQPGIARPVAVPGRYRGLALCVLVPLPVKQTTATILWPAPGRRSGRRHHRPARLPPSMDVSIPCTAIATLSTAGGLVFPTIPPAGIDATATAR